MRSIASAAQIYDPADPLSGLGLTGLYQAAVAKCGICLELSCKCKEREFPKSKIQLYEEESDSLELSPYDKTFRQKFLEMLPKDSNEAYSMFRKACDLQSEPKNVLAELAERAKSFLFDQNDFTLAKEFQNFLKDLVTTSQKNDMGMEP